MVNRFFKRTPYDMGLYVPPIEVIQQTLEKSQQAYDKNLTLVDQVKHNYIPSLPQDRAKANAIQKEWNDRVDSIVNKYNGDYSQATKDLNNLLLSIKDDISPGGTAHAIVSNYNNYNNWLTSQRDRVKSGKVLAEDMNLAHNYYMQNYTGIGEVDPITGSYNQFNPEELMDYTDPEAKIQDIYKGFKPEKRKVGTSTVENGFIKYNVEEVEGIDKDRLHPSFRQGLMGDPKLLEYLTQKAKFSGADPRNIAAYIDHYSAQRAKDLSYLNKSTDTKLERDPYFVAMAKAKKDKENLQAAFSFLQNDVVAPNESYLEPKFNASDWKSSLGVNENKFIVTPYPGLRLYGNDLSDTVSNNITLDSFLKDSANDDKLVRSNVIPGLMRALWEKKKDDFKTDFNSKYGKNPTWTKKFEEDFMWDYKKEAKNNSAYATKTLNIPLPDKNKVLLERLPEVLAGSASVYMPGENGVYASDRLPSKILNTLYNSKEGKLKDLGSIDVDYVIGGTPGYQTSGFQVRTPEGTFVIKDNDTQRSRWSSMLESALNPIFLHGKEKGGEGIAGFDPATGRPYLGTPRVKWEKSDDPNRQLQMNLYWDIPSADGKQTITVKKDYGELMTEAAHVFNGALGFGASKSAATPFNYFLQQQAISQMINQ